MTITVTATIGAGVAVGSIISNQAALAYDADGNGTNEASALSDDPRGGRRRRSTNIMVPERFDSDLSTFGLWPGLELLAGLAFALLRRRKSA